MASLGRLATRLVAYRFRVFQAVMALSITAAIILVWIGLSLVHILYSTMPWTTPLITAVFVATAFAAVIPLIRVFHKVLTQVGRLYPGVPGHRVPIVAYSLPFAAYGASPPILPRWHEWGWYAAAVAAQAIMAVFFETPLARRYPELGISIYRLSAAILAAGLPLVVATGLGNPDAAAVLGAGLAVFSYLAAALNELRRAEELL